MGETTKTDGEASAMEAEKLRQKILEEKIRKDVDRLSNKGSDGSSIKVGNDTIEFLGRLRV